MDPSWVTSSAFLHVFSLPKVEEDGSARHKKKCPPSPVWETQMLGEEGWGGVEAKIDCSCRFELYLFSI